MTYAVTIYVEAGPLDGEVRVCGPFRSRDEAVTNMHALVEYGHVDVVVLEPTCDSIIREIEAAAE